MDERNGARTGRLFDKLLEDENREMRKETRPAETFIKLNWVLYLDQSVQLLSELRIFATEDCIDPNRPKYRKVVRHESSV
jgi:hypothetical protein